MRLIYWKVSLGTSLLVQWPRLYSVNAGGMGSIPGQGTRSHMLYLRVHMLQLRPRAAKEICASAKSFRHVWLFVTPWTVAHQASPSMEFYRQEDILAWRPRIFREQGFCLAPVIVLLWFLGPCRVYWLSEFPIVTWIKNSSVSKSHDLNYIPLGQHFLQAMLRWQRNQATSFWAWHNSDVGTSVTCGIGSPSALQVIISQVDSTAHSCASEFKHSICCLMLIQKPNRHSNQLKTETSYRLGVGRF